MTLVKQCGGHCIVCARDAKTGAHGKWELFTHGGRKPTGIDAVAFATMIAERGAGEILLTSMDRDGTKAGFNLPMTRAISDAVSVPVIASGGVGNLDHLVAGVTEGGASAVLAASIFHFGEYTIAEAKAHRLLERLDGGRAAQRQRDQRTVRARPRARAQP